MNYLLFGRIVSRDGPDIGDPRTRTYTVRWSMPNGSELLMPGMSTREVTGNDIHRRAFSLGSQVFGMMTGSPERPIIMIMDREDYAVGCG